MDESKLGANPTAELNDIGLSHPRDQWTPVHVSWWTKVPSSDDSIASRIRADFDKDFFLVGCKRVWRNPNGGLEPIWYHVISRRFPPRMREQFGEPLHFEDPVPEEMKGDIFERQVLEEEPIIKDGRPSTPLSIDERLYQSVASSYQLMDKFKALVIHKMRMSEIEERRNRNLDHLMKELEYKFTTDAAYVGKALRKDAGRGHEDKTVLHQPGCIMPGTEFYRRPSGLLIAKG